MIKLLLFLLIVGISVNAHGQSVSLQKDDQGNIQRKGKLLLYYGWNRSVYSKSDIQFKGDGYNFTLAKVVAHDRPTHFDPRVYFNPTKISIPQYQFRMGYYLSDMIAISAGFNHMKYVVDQFQTVKITGTIDTPEAANYNGNYHQQDIILDEDFLQFEHTNGLNYLNVNFDRTETLWSGKQKWVSVNAVFGVGVGILYPKSDVKLFGNGVDRWHFAGYGVSSHLALRIEFLRNLFVQMQLEGGFINMPDIITTGKYRARAKQHFLYREETVVFGGYIPLFTMRK